MVKSIFSLFLIFNFLTPGFPQVDENLSWPLEIKFSTGRIVIYQPQIENFEGKKMDSRAAVSIYILEEAPIFGAMWFTSDLTVDSDKRIVYFDQIKIARARFPDRTEESVERLSQRLEEWLNEKSFSMSLDRLIASMDVQDGIQDHIDGLNNAPPDIYYEEAPAVLILVDGEPIIKEVENSELKSIVNTPHIIAYDPSSEYYYLKGGKWWYSSKQITSGWENVTEVPLSVSKLGIESIAKDEAVDSAALEIKTPPKVIVSTRPAELIQTNGKPDFRPLQNTDLLYLENSENDVVLHIETQEYYIILAGRWYKSKSLSEGPWQHVSPKNIPADFNNIPPESAMANLRVSIPGTNEAKDALLENSIPQTATVDRTTTVNVTFDGEPKFTKIQGSDVYYAENTNKTVLLIKNKYYCVDQGIWFESTRPTGPYSVSIERPEEVDQIPASSPAYNVKYVYIYDYTPSVVYVGYTPAYYGSYVYRGTIVYGTGYYYDPWYYNYYYPRPITYGYGAHYNPYTGWGFSTGVSYGWISYQSYNYSYWGPAGYRYGYRHGYYHGYYNSYQRGYARGYYDARKPVYSQTRPPTNSRNIYKGRQGITSVDNKTRQTLNNNYKSTQTPVNRPQNNVYTDRNGNVYKRTPDGNWQQRSNNQWQNPNPNIQNKNTQAPNRTIQNQNSNQNLNREYQNRMRGNQRVQSYQKSRGTGEGIKRR